MAKEVITRFKLETTAFDSAIKKASKDLSDYSKTATQAKEGFNQFTKSEVDAARAIGTMATSSTNAKGKVQELVGSYNELVKTYSRLTDEQKQSDFAKAMADSMTTLQQRIKDAKQELYGLGEEMKKNGGGGLFSGDKLSGMLQVFGGNLMTKGAGMLAGLADEMGDMVKQGIELAKQGEGIRIAFERLGRGDILDGLREATHGTVTDLELMKAAVKFNDFKLPVEELGTMLAFAQQKAKDTGQSIDYMVDSIVTGLGRKSLMILDNLGLSAAEIREKMKQTGDMTKAVGEIIREQMAKAGDYVETAADRATKATVSLENKMEELGRKFAPVEEASNHLWTSMKIGILDIIGGPLATLLNQLTEAGRLKNQLLKTNGGGNGQPSKVDTQLGKLLVAKANGSDYMMNSLYNNQMLAYGRQINAADKYVRQFEQNRSKINTILQQASKEFGQKFGSISELTTYRDAFKSMRDEYQKGAKEIMKPVEVNVNTDKGIKGIKELQKQLKELEAQRKKAVKAGDQEQVELLTKQINETKQNISYLDPNALKTPKKTEKTEVQENQEKIKKLSEEYAKLGDKETEAARKRQEEIQKEIELLQKRNGLLNLRMEQAQGRLLNADTRMEGMRNVSGVGRLDQTVNFGKSISVPKEGLQLSDKMMKSVEKNIEKSLPKAKEKDPMKESKKFISGLSEVASGLEQMGVKLPEEVQQVLGVINGLMSVIEGVNTIIGITQASLLTANTTAMGALTAALWANTASSIFGLSNGGVVPTFANGGLIGKAAGGMMIPGNSFSGDNLRLPVDGGRGMIGVNSGELILNRSQQSNLANQLQGGGLSGLNLYTEISMEKLRVGLTTNSMRRGKGEYVTSKRMR